MAHLEKFKQCDIRRVMGEITRESNFYKGNVDLSRTHNNYTLCMYGGRIVQRPVKNEDGKAAVGAIRARTVNNFMQCRIDKLPHRKTKATVGMASWCVTCPTELKSDPAKVRWFFEIIYLLTVKRYGEKNVQQGFVHMDETSPHIHILFVPEFQGTLNAKKLITANELRNYQQELDNICEREFGQKGLILNGKTKGNYTVDELRERSKQKQELQEQTQRLQGALVLVDELVNQIEDEQKQQKYRSQAARLGRYISNSVNTPAPTKQQTRDYQYGG
jgi:hypothetical protein